MVGCRCTSGRLIRALPVILSCMNDSQALNVLGGQLEVCGNDPVTGWFRDGCCNTDAGDVGSHTICAVVSREFLDHQAGIGNDLATPHPEQGFAGLNPGDRWCVTAANWLRAHIDGAASPVVLAATHELATQIVPLDILSIYAVDVPGDAASLAAEPDS